jgi:hypothetical protein
MSMTVGSHDVADAAFLADAVFGQLDEMVDDLDGQVLVSQSRCVDHLLDLMNLTTNEAIRTVITEVLDDIRHLSVVRADEMESCYALLGAVAAVEAAFETYAP